MRVLRQLRRTAQASPNAERLLARVKTLSSSQLLPILVPGAAALALAAGMLVETSTWWLRALAPAQQLGLYISRSNILAYGMRALLIFYNALVAFFIETGAEPRVVALVLGLSFVLAGVLQIGLLSRGEPTLILLKTMTRAMLLPTPKALPSRDGRVQDKRLFMLVILATIIFSLGMTLPLLIAVLVPEFRLSISYIGQIINIFGMILVLFYIDQQLYRAMDAGTLLDDVTDYTYGRLVAFLLTGLAFLAVTSIEAFTSDQPAARAPVVKHGGKAPA